MSTDLSLALYRQAGKVVGHFEEVPCERPGWFRLGRVHYVRVSEHRKDQRGDVGTRQRECVRAGGKCAFDAEAPEDDE